MEEISLRPYTGRLFIATSKEDYTRGHQELFKQPDVLNCSIQGRFSGGEGTDGYWTYLVYASKPHYLAHELAHVVFHVFERAGIDPRDSCGEAFCYMLSQLIIDAKRSQQCHPSNHRVRRVKSTPARSQKDVNLG